jgi:glycosyltransferase involved in cell wall biosynthesis
MRIVYVLTSLGMGGAERQVVALASRMAGRGHAVALIVLRPPVTEQWPTDLRVFHLGMLKNPASFLAAMARGRRFLAEFHPDVVHSHSFHANIAARLLRITLPALPVVSSVHNVYEGDWGRMLAYRLTNRLARITTAVSQAAADRFVHLKAVSQEKCIVMPNGIDFEEFALSRERRQQARAAMGVEREFVWLTAGRIVPAKDYPNLLRAFQRVLALRQDARLWVAGAGETAEFSRVRFLAADLGLDQAVRWLGLRRDMPALLDAADGFVLGSAWEGMPLSVGEAMAMAKPVVCTDVGGVREMVGEAGILAPSKDSDALAVAMLDVMRVTPEDRQALGCAARERILRDFSMDTATSKWEALYRMALGIEQ